MNGSKLCQFNHKRPNAGNMYLDGPCTVFLVFLGLVGNFYGLQRLNRIQIGRNFKTYLLTLVIWDLVVLVCALMEYGLLNSLFLLPTDAYHLPVWSYLANIFYGPLVTALTGSCWTTVAIAILRYLAVARPGSHRRNATGRHVSICLSLSAAAVLYSIPVNFEVTTVECFDPVTGRNEVQIWPNLFLVEDYWLFYRSYAYLALVSLGPFAAILGLSVRTVSLVHRSLERAPSSRRSESFRRRRKMGVLFSILLLKFLVCNFPSMAVFLFTSIYGRRFISVLGEITHSLCNVSTLFHHATNFLIYPPWYENGWRNGSKSYDVIRKLTMSEPRNPALRNLRTGFEEIKPECYKKSCPNLTFSQSENDFSRCNSIVPHPDDVLL